jgi:hypothetical protein
MGGHGRNFLLYKFRTLHAPSQSRVCCYCPLALNNGTYARCRNPQSNRQGIDRHRQWLKQFLAQHLAGMGGQLGVAIALMVVDDFDIGGSFLSPGKMRNRT